MRAIKEVNDLIEKSLRNAGKYAEKSILWKSEYPALSRALYEASINEMNNVNKLHAEIVDLIQSYRDEKGEPPAPMLAVYEYLHEKNIGEAKEVKALQDTYKTA